MKNLILFFSIILSFASCSQNEENKTQENSIIGTWQLIERFDGGSINPLQEIQNGKKIQFTEDGTLIDSSLDCNGTFSINNSILSVNLPCPFQNTLNYSFSFENENLLLTDYPTTCDEGCFDKFKRMN